MILGLAILVEHRLYGWRTEMATMAMAIPLLGALWPLMVLASALFRTMLFNV